MEHFVSYFGELIHLKLRSRLRSAQAIEDVRQETFARVLAAVRDEKIRQPERFGAFVNSMCNNVRLEHLRQLKRYLSPEDGVEQDLPDHSADSFGAYARQQAKEKVNETLADLPERDRRLLFEIFLLEKDKDEVCRELHISRDYLRVLLHRAKLSFKSKYLDS
jgi:RNA polymerase sigma-70 factor (ECF subfamily)